ncbi:hypothetical protein [Salinispira pacifica]
MIDRAIYSKKLHSSATDFPLPLAVVETDEDLYWDIAHLLYFTIREDVAAGRDSVMILPVGPVFQYRRFVSLYRRAPIDLSRLHCFFMDEYLLDERTPVDRNDPLSFRGFIDRELAGPLAGMGAFDPARIHFPDPARPSDYDAALESHGNASLCVAGVGITGHVAFNDPPEPGDRMSDDQFRKLPTRVVRLPRETVVINSNTAMRGAFDQIPALAVTVGMKQILASRKIRIYLNRPWQSAVVRKLLYAEPGASFPVTLLRSHPDVQVTLTAQVAQLPDFMLR